MMGQIRNSYDYAVKVRKATRNYRCYSCGGYIWRGEEYELRWHGREHKDNCPTEKWDRAARQCKS